MNKLKFGFTLAEVLITLGIIGVVAAMTIPTLLNKYYEKRTVSILRETQSIIAQSMKMAEEEDGDMEGWFTVMTETATSLKIAENLKPFLKIALDCGVNDPKNRCVINKSYLEKNGKPRINYSEELYYKICLLNGSCIWWVFVPYAHVAQFYIDTNGKYSPNMWGKDLFMFEYSKNSLRPIGAPDSLYPYESECKPKNSTGIGCAFYVLTQQNMNYLH